MKTVFKAFAKWNIPILEDKDYVEYLQENFPEKVYYMDEYPFATTEKHSQIELLYQDVVGEKDTYRKYIEREDMYVKAMSILWLYNDVLVSSNLCNMLSEKEENKMGEGVKRNINKLKSNFKNSNVIEVDNLQDLELLIRLSKRDIVFSEFHLKKYEILVIPSWSCFVMFFNDKNIIAPVEKILNVCGLFLRPFQTNNSLV